MPPRRFSCFPIGEGRVPAKRHLTLNGENVALFATQVYIDVDDVIYHDSQLVPKLNISGFAQSKNKYLLESHFQNVPFYRISASGSNFNPRNT
jgi:hypothetical protein